MNRTENILEKARQQGLATPCAGMKVPQGYFDTVSDNIIGSLPVNAAAEGLQVPGTRTIWQRVRPYIYMAAMFAGIWLMLQMFAALGGSRPLVPIESNPVLAKALSDDDFVFDYLYNDLSSYEIYDAMSEADALLDDAADMQGADTTAMDVPEGVIMPDTTL